MAVIRKEAYYTSCNGKNKIRTLIWQDDEEAAMGVVQIAHGVCEHIGRYDEFARFLVANGFIVCGNDHLGHGKSVNSIEELGFVDDGDNVNMVRDMNTLYRIMHKRYPSLPYFIIGHSMGSFLARIYAAAFGMELSGAVFCGTGQLPAPVMLLEDPTAHVLGMLPPDSTSANVMSDIFSKVTKKVLDEKDDLAWLSASSENREKCREDPMVCFPMGNSLIKELVTLAVKASRPDWAAKLPQNFPVLLVSGAKDPIGFFGRGVLNTADALMKAGIEPEVILYPGDRHEILQEDDREKVFNDILTFLRSVTDNTDA